MDIFRHALQKNELSERVYRLTRAVISLNPGNYTAWYLRRKCLDLVPELQDKILAEIEYLNNVILNMTKVYQYWHHRRVVVQKYGKVPANEYEILDNVYNEDDKNYHMWTYRIWITQTYGAWEYEAKDILRKIEENPKNNSSWSYHYFIIFHHADYTKVAKEEVEFSKSYITKDLNNESAWVYYKGIIMFSPQKTLGDKSAAQLLAEQLKEEAKSFCENIRKADERNRFARGMLVDLYKDNSETKAKAKAICDELVLVDKIRKNYWLWIKEGINSGVKEAENKLEELKV